MTFKMNDVAQTIKVYNLRADTNEFIGESDAYIPPHTGLPADCTDIKPPSIPDGCVAVFDDVKKNWSTIEDLRGCVVFSIDNGKEIFIDELGPLPEKTTSVSPNGPYQKWDGDKWVDDDEAVKAAYQSQAESERQRRISAAEETMADWRVELQLETISDDDKKNLGLWINYKKELRSLDLSSIIDESTFMSFEWPPTP